MADVIIVDLPWINELKTDIHETTDRLRRDSSDAVVLTSASGVDGRATDFMNKWDERRGNLADCLQGVEDLLQAIFESFSGTEQALIDALNGE